VEFEIWYATGTVVGAWEGSRGANRIWPGNLVGWVESARLEAGHRFRVTICRNQLQYLWDSSSVASSWHWSSLPKKQLAPEISGADLWNSVQAHSNQLNSWVRKKRRTNSEFNLHGSSARRLKQQWLTAGSWSRND
jgi:hypothetical protein